MTTPAATVHASAVQAGEVGILIRGPSGAGKSRLAFDLILAGRAGRIPRTQLIGDDRVLLSAEDGRISIRPAAELEGLIEIRGLGIRRCDFVTQAALGLVVDLAADDAARMPEPDALATLLYGIKIPRIPVGTGFDALPFVMAALLTSPFPDARPASLRRLPEGNW
jgi:serine kinase of HPr protein (carbohydrate metabolism regulator)